MFEYFVVEMILSLYLFYIEVKICKF